MKGIKILLLACFSFLMTEIVNAQNHMRTYDDATTGIAGFSYDISISYKLLKGWSKARPSEVYSVKLVHVVPSSKGFFYSRSKKQFYTCAELGSSCNPNNWRQVIVDLTGRCKSASKDRISFSRINEEKTIEHWVEENGSCSFDGLEGNVIQESMALIKIIDAKEQGKTTSSGSSGGSLNSSSSSSQNNETETASSSSGSTSTTASPTYQQIPDSYKGNPLTYNKTIPSGSTDKFSQNVQAVGELANAAAPLLEQWSNNMQKRRDAEQRRQKEETERKKENAEQGFKALLNEYLPAANMGDEKARLILIFDFLRRASWGNNFVHLLPDLTTWIKEAVINKNFEAMNYMGVFLYNRPIDIISPGYGITSKEEVVKTLEDAGNLGSLDAMVLLGNYYNQYKRYYGAYGHKDWREGGANEEKALYWYSKAADSGSPVANYNMGMIYRYRSTKTDVHKCIKYKIIPNDILAFKYFLKSTSNPNYEETEYQKIWSDGSCFNKSSYKELSIMYEKGIGVTKDKEIAKKLYEEYLK